MQVDKEYLYLPLFIEYLNSLHQLAYVILFLKKVL